MHIVGKRDGFIDADRNSNEFPFVAVTTCSVNFAKVVMTVTSLPQEENKNQQQQNNPTYSLLCWKDRH